MNDGNSLDQLAQNCAEESQGLREEGDCYELFRLALEEKNQRAWTLVVDQYWRLVIYWIGPAEPEAEDTSNRAWFLFWRALSKPGIFARFPQKGAVLCYLWKCALAARQSRRRYRSRRPPPADISDAGALALVSSSEQQDEQIDRQQRLDAIHQWCKHNLNETEYLVFRLSFQAGMKPKEIFERHRERFPDVKTIYRIKERIIRGLQGGLGGVTR